MKIFGKDASRVMSKADAAVLSVYAAILFFGGMLFLACVDDLGLAPAFGGWFLYLIAVCVLYRFSLNNRAVKVILAVLRTAALILMVGAFVFPVICTGFEKNVGMYAAKRYVYINGVKKSAGDILPESIPRGAADYYFRTDKQLLAQDYRPYAYLVIHTDRAYLKDYEAMISQNTRYTRTVCDLETEAIERDRNEYSGEYAYLNACPNRLPRYIYDRVYKDAGIHDDLDGSVIFCGDDDSTWNPYTGALINYDTGLLVIWR